MSKVHTDDGFKAENVFIFVTKLLPFVILVLTLIIICYIPKGHQHFI